MVSLATCSHSEVSAQNAAESRVWVWAHLSTATQESVLCVTLRQHSGAGPSGIVVGLWLRRPKGISIGELIPPLICFGVQRQSPSPTCCQSLPPMAVRKDAYNVTSLGELSLPLTSCNTQESRPWSLS